jgi:hypothetical protein
MRREGLLHLTDRPSRPTGLLGRFYARLGEL